MPQANDATVEADYQTLCRFLRGPNTTFASIVTEALDTSLDAATAYAAEVGLAEFAIDGPQAGVYRVDQSTGQPGFRATGRAVTSLVLSNGRPRIKLPFRLCGHFMCTEPENLTGIFWCFDLLRSGYIFAHVPMPLGPRKISLFGQLAKNCLSRIGWLPDVASRLRDVASRFQRTSSPRSTFRQMARRRAPIYRSHSRRVLMITSTYTLGGAERQMVIAASALLERGYDVRIMALYPSEPGSATIEGELAKLGITPIFVLISRPLKREDFGRLMGCRRKKFPACPSGSPTKSHPSARRSGSTDRPSSTPGWIFP